MRRSDLPAVAIGLIPLLVRLSQFPGYLGADDAYIHAAVINNLRAGGGWGINPGENVNISTAPAFTLGMLAVSWFVPDVMRAGSVLSSVATTLYVYAVHRVARRLTGSAVAGWMAAALAALNPLLWRWTGTFMETTPALAAAMCLVGGFLLWEPPPPHKQDLLRPAWFGLGLGVAILVRPELAALPPVFALHDLANRERCPRRAVDHAVAGGVAAGVLAVWCLAAYALFGTVVPSTFHAKTTSGWAPSVVVAGQIGRTLVAGYAAVSAVTLVALAAALRDGEGGGRAVARGLREGLVLWAFPATVLLFFVLRTGTLQSPARYVLPCAGTLPVLAVVLALRSMRRPWRVLASAASVQVVIAAVLTARTIGPTLRGMETNYLRAMTEISAALKSACQPGDVAVIAYDIGVVSWRDHGACRLADAGLLASPQLRGMSVPEIVGATGARFAVTSLGSQRHWLKEALLENGYGVELIESSRFEGQGLSSAGQLLEARLYRITAEADAPAPAGREEDGRGRR